MRTIKDPSEKQRWEKVKEVIAIEVKLVKDIGHELALYKVFFSRNFMTLKEKAELTRPASSQRKRFEDVDVWTPPAILDDSSGTNVTIKTAAPLPRKKVVRSPNRALNNPLPDWAKEKAEKAIMKEPVVAPVSKPPPVSNPIPRKTTAPPKVLFFLTFLFSQTNPPVKAKQVTKAVVKTPQKATNSSKPVTKDSQPQSQQPNIPKAESPPKDPNAPQPPNPEDQPVEPPPPRFIFYLLVYLFS